MIYNLKLPEIHSLKKFEALKHNRFWISTLGLPQSLKPMQTWKTPKSEAALVPSIMDKGYSACMMVHFPNRSIVAKRRDGFSSCLESGKWQSWWRTWAEWHLPFAGIWGLTHSEMVLRTTFTTAWAVHSISLPRSPRPGWAPRSFF
jgi:hypothetical protein